MLYVKRLVWLICLCLLIQPKTTIMAQSNSEIKSADLINQAMKVEGAYINVGIIQDGQSTYQVYSEDESVDSNQVFEYEIGSITKTFTGTMIAKAVDEGLIDLDAEMDEYIPYIYDLDYPTVRQLLTHTSGYPTFIENQLISRNILADSNPYLGVTTEMIRVEASENIPDMTKKHEFQYANFNAGLLGLVLESVYKESYSDLLNHFITTDLGLNSTHLYYEETELGNNWVWEYGDGYAPAAAIISNIEDMMRYAKRQLESTDWIEKSHQSLAQIDATTNEMDLYGLRQDEMGYQWMLNSKDQIIWHDGATGGYTSFIGFNPKEQTAVVVLSNVPINEGVTSAMIGGVLLKELLDK